MLQVSARMQVSLPGPGLEREQVLGCPPRLQAQVSPASGRWLRVPGHSLRLRARVSVVSPASERLLWALKEPARARLAQRKPAQELSLEPGQFQGLPVELVPEL